MEPDDKAAVTRVLADYYKAFSTFDVPAISPYFHEPCLFITPQGVAAVPTHAEMKASFTSLLEDLRARGFSRSELTMLQVTPLSATTALANGVAVRYKADGQELERVGVMYVLNKADGHWRIAVTVIHDPESLLRQ